MKQIKQGASRHALRDRGADLYETPEAATLALLRVEPLVRNVWEPAAGRGAISRVLRATGRTVLATDLIAYDAADNDVVGGCDFFEYQTAPPSVEVIVTNPPYNIANEFIRHGLSLGLKTVVLLRLMALEGTARSDLIDRQLRRVWAGKERLPMMHRYGWRGPKIPIGGMPFAWFVFEPNSRLGTPIELQRMSWRGDA